MRYGTRPATSGTMQYEGLTLEYTIEAYNPGRFSGRWEDCYPPEGGEIEIVSCDPIPVSSLSHRDYERICTAITEHASMHACEYRD